MAELFNGDHIKCLNTRTLYDHYFVTTSPTLRANKDALFDDFVAKCLEQNAESRWSAAQLLKHPFLEDAPSDVVFSTPPSEWVNEWAHGMNPECYLQSLSLRWSMFTDHHSDDMVNAILFSLYLSRLLLSKCLIFRSSMIQNVDFQRSSPRGIDGCCHSDSGCSSPFPWI